MSTTEDGPIGAAADEAAASTSALTDEAQNAAEKAITGLQELTNHIFDAGEAGLEEALKVVDRAQTEVSNLLSQLTNLLGGKISGTRKG